MAESKQQQEWLGIYTQQGGGTPVAIVAADGPVREVKRAFAGQTIRIEPVETRVPENAGVAELFAQPEAEVQPDAEQSADEALKAEIRAALVEEERRKALTEDVKKEMAAERKASQA